MRKKILVSLLSVLSILCLCFNVSADTSTPSVTYKTDIEFTGAFDGNYEEITSSTVKYTASDGCHVVVELTPYSKKDTISNGKTAGALVKAEESKAELQTAFDEIKNADEVVDFAPVLEGTGKNFGIEDSCMVISNLFDITTYSYKDTGSGSEYNEEHNHSRLYNIKLTTDSLQYFMALIHYDAATDTWEVVPGAKVTGEARDTLTFTFDENSPFAIVSCGAKGSCQLGYKGTKETGTDGRKVENTSSGKYFIANSKTGVYFTYLLIGLLIISLTLNVYFVLKQKENKK